MVAIDTSQNKLFTHRLLPVHSPEFDNVIDQVITILVAQQIGKGWLKFDLVERRGGSMGML